MVYKTSEKYLSDRQHSVKRGFFKSNFQNILNGVPQG